MAVVVNVASLFFEPLDVFGNIWRFEALVDAWIDARFLSRQRRGPCHKEQENPTTLHGFPQTKAMQQMSQPLYRGPCNAGFAKLPFDFLAAVSSDWTRHPSA